MQKRERPLPAPAAALEPISEEEKAAALAILKAEVDYVRKAMGHESISAEEYAETASAIEKDFIYIPSRQRYERSASATNSDKLESIQVGSRPAGPCYVKKGLCWIQWSGGNSSAACKLCADALRQQ